MAQAKQYPDKKCPICGKVFNRARYNGRLEDAIRYLKRTTCSQSCANSREHPTHRTTYHLRAQQFKGTVCERCLSPDNLDVHHKDGNIKNNAPENLETICHPCHMKLHWQLNPSFGGTVAKQTQVTV